MGGLTAADKQKILGDIAEFKKVKGVSVDEIPAGPRYSRSGEVAATSVPLIAKQNGKSAKGPDLVNTEKAVLKIARAGAPAGLTVHSAGAGGILVAFIDAFNGLDGALLLAAGLVVVVILLFVYRSPILWAYPIVCAVLALGAASIVIYGLAKNGTITLNGQSQGILSVLVIGAGTDYALLLISRYREELHEYPSRVEAMIAAWKGAAPPIIASAVTVILGLICLTFAELNSTAGLGPVCAIGIGCTVLVMLTVLPALLVISGRWIFWPKRPRVDHQTDILTVHGVWGRFSKSLAVHYRRAWIGAGVVLIACLAGIFTLKTQGLSTEKGFTNTPEAITGQKIYNANFEKGAGAPAIILTSTGTADQVAQSVAKVKGVEPTQVCIATDFAKVGPALAKDPQAAARIFDRSGCATADYRVTPHNGKTLVDATLTSSYDSRAAYQTIRDIRKTVGQGAGRRRAGGRPVGGQPRRPGRLPARPEPDHPARAAGDPGRPGLRAAGPGGAGDPHRDGGAVVPRVAGGECGLLQPRLPLRERRPGLPAVRVRVPRGPGDRLQHLPDDQGAGGDARARHAAGGDPRAGGHRRRHHLGRPGAGGHVRGARGAADRLPRRDRLHGGVRRPARHRRGPLDPRAGAEPRDRQEDLVAVQARGRGREGLTERRFLRSGLWKTPSRPAPESSVDSMSATFKLRGYTVERLLGSGGSGEVWQARVTSSGAPVALKRVATASEDQRQRARAEAALLSALDHPNLVRLHSMVPAHDALVLVLDLADGGSLADLLAARGRLTPGEVITAVAPVAAALAYLHGEGVVHGDVSPGNILFTAAGVPLLADVGVARLTGDDTDAEATPAYVDPAVAAGCVPGAPSDVFMLGGVALHALTGAPPWPARDGAAALRLAAAGGLDDVAARLATADVSPAMAAVVARALAIDPQRRGTAADLALDLRHSGEPVAVELAAGAARPGPQALTGPRHAARPIGPEPADRSRPAFDRPQAVTPGGPAPTRIVGPRPRPVIPRGPRRQARPWAARLVGALLLAAALAVGGTLWAWAAGSGDGPAGRRPANPRAEVATSPKAGVASVPPARAATPRPAAAPASARPAPTRPSAVQRWAAALAGLDRLRARAFATRDPSLLRRVYRPGPLLTADTALLARLVPTGCGLAGARTRYTSVRVAAKRGRVTVLATATLPPSQLVCGGRVRATAPGAGPSRLRIDLVRTGDGVRIAGETLA